MKLVYAQPSPFVRKVMVVLHEAGQTAAVELLEGFGSPIQPNDNAMAINPTGKIPSLQLDDGSTLYDSRVITRYLDQLYQVGLYPSGDIAFRTLNLEAHADAMLDAGVLCVYEVRCRDEAARSADWVTAQQGKISRALDALENDWIEHLNGPLDIGQIGVGCALEYLDFRQQMGGWDGWRDSHPRLSSWCEAFSARKSMQATKPQ